MRYSILPILIATPALAHHEAVAVSMVPSMVVAAAIGAPVLAAALRWFLRRNK